MARNSLARRSGESFWQHQSRVVRARQEQRGKGEPLVTMEAEQHALYEDKTVLHVETFTQVVTKRNRLTSALETMRDKGQLTAAQVDNAKRIAMIAEGIQCRRPMRQP
jgi:hypothetical protein